MYALAGGRANRDRHSSGRATGRVCPSCGFDVWSKGGRPMDWVHRARCKDEDPELFFPIGTTGPAALQIAAAKPICMQCEVRTEGLEWAMATGKDAAVGGGLAEERGGRRRRAGRGT